VAKIELINISKKFDTPRLVWLNLPFLNPEPDRPKSSRQRAFEIKNLNLTIPHGKTMVILGPSGCGKTTLLRLIAGLVPPDSGEVRFNGVDMKEVPPRERRIGMLFQNYALYPHLTNRTNILAYFFFRKKTPALDAEAQAKYKRTSELLGVEIEYLQDRFPATLSGGERQRVALGRCITRDPALFLLDEPFSNLDPKLREKYRAGLKTLLAQFNITTVYVTHDQTEAFLLADTIAVMDDGRIEQVGTYDEIYTRPKNIFIAEFLNLDAATPAINLIDGARVASRFAGNVVGVRPEAIHVYAEPRDARVQSVVTHRMNLPLKDHAILTMRAGEHSVVAYASLAERWQTGDTAWLEFTQFHTFDQKSGLREQTISSEHKGD